MCRRGKSQKFLSIQELEISQRIVNELRAEVTTLKNALEKIFNPIKYLSEEAKESGANIDGNMAVQLSKDPNWLREIAKSALAISDGLSDKVA